MLDVKKLLTKMLTVKTVDFTPTAGTNYSGYGNCWYQQWGRLVHVHIGVGGLTANTATTIYTMPSGLRPRTQLVTIGRSGNTASFAYMSIGVAGAIVATPQQTYATGEFYYFV